MAPMLWRLCLACCLLAAAAQGAVKRLPLKRVSRRVEQVAGAARVTFSPRGVDFEALLAAATAAPPLQLAGEPGARPVATMSATADVRRPLHDGYDMMYVLDAEVGTPQATVRLLVDTGSSDLWVAPGLYTIADSTTAKQVPGPIALLRYGMGQVSGQEVSDNICLQSLCVVNQTFVAAQQITGLGNAVGRSGLFDGLLGLAYPALASATRHTILEDLRNHGPWKRLAFGLSLQGMNDGHDGQGSFITFGNVEEVVKEAPTNVNSRVTLPVWAINSEARFWLVDFRISTPTGSDLLPAEPFLLAALDSGTSLIAAPGLAYPLLLSRILPLDQAVNCEQLFGQLLCPCSTPLKPMTMSFRSPLGESLSVTLTSKDLLQFVAEAFSPSGDRMDLCRIGIQPGPPGMPFWILGDVFLRHVYAVHDVYGEQVTLFGRPGEETEASLESAFAATTPSAGKVEDRRASPHDLVAGLAAAFSILAVALLGVALLLRGRAQAGIQCEEGSGDYGRL